MHVRWDIFLQPEIGKKPLAPRKVLIENPLLMMSQGFGRGTTPLSRRRKCAAGEIGSVLFWNATKKTGIHLLVILHRIWSENNNPLSDGGTMVRSVRDPDFSIELG
ncbi:hypothetical protein JTE90_020924 [Oedothorax gibbosus]|uniref:Uncharacterized protein n=1 Tax=Oedothorax gibbosus TaxID=931172 RepID=A0AAV6VQU2_9ARAC|nr:hypothetical protein JTE90_020924 [Oedothorax gibbosus]